MRRRQYLKATAVASAAGLAGCSGVLGGGGGGPAGVAKNWLKAAKNGNEDKVDDLTHPDSMMSGATDELVQAMSEADFSIQNTSVEEKDDDEALVEAKLKDNESGESDTAEMGLQTDDGDWKVYSFGSMGAGGGGGGTTQG